MQFKYILKSLFLTSLCASVYAAPARDDCKELGSLLGSGMGSCKVNDKGEMIELSYSTYNEKATEEAYKKALSYSTLKKLDFSTEYSDCKELSYGLTNLKNLEELKIESFRGKLVPNTLKGLTSLKKFTYTTNASDMGDFSKKNLEELSTLTSLESLSFGYAYLEKDGLKSLQNLKNVTSLTLFSNGKGGMDVKGTLANLKNLKELTVDYDVKNQNEIDAIAAYGNLEKLKIGLRNNDGKIVVNCDNFKNLKKLTTLDLEVDDLKEVPKFVYSIPNLKTLIYNGKEVKLGAKDAKDAKDNKDNKDTKGNNDKKDKKRKCVVKSKN